MRERNEQRVRPRPPGRRGVVTAALAVAMGILGAGESVPPASAASSATRHDVVQQGLDGLVRTDGMPAALASVTDGEGRTRTYTAGVGDLATGAEVPRDGQIRIGSNTKAFTAVVVMQLVAEGKVRLGEHIDTYLPGLVHGDGIDGGGITVRQLLQHRSGLPNYANYLSDEIRRYEPRELLGLALRHKADFKPGKGWKYSNTNYLVAGLLVEKVTGRPLAAEIERRVIRRAGLRHTYFPAPGELRIRGPHPKGYDRASEGAPFVDATEWDPSWAWAAGQLVSTNSDLNRFYSALLRGRLVPEPQLRQMRGTVPAGDPFAEGAGYGLGLVSTPLSCGGVYWGHGGSMTGYETRGGVTEDGRAVNVAVTTQPGRAVRKHMEGLVDKALCSARP
ncbi:MULTISPECIES: serine hydrolase domain-containing protein [Streptomyces]|uniref:serine hydrolase domain-containing protein n=1 Tax=Streptomyces TaxID=1883 RepID=UPI00163CB88C|nr:MULTISPECIES: serine hydrolase domain-containing protein [Streptomyces]MBC2877244.1 beta-lactamase family protein [Streptomyces sp. TYQ1024]UBI39510.1 beta-lactamase family protein [Streptomyces mobaraensis]UKW32089.1 beta-lactamase family protein [Streptomyces sp. TYQ1024]